MEPVSWLCAAYRAKCFIICVTYVWELGKYCVQVYLACGRLCGHNLFLSVIRGVSNAVCGVWRYSTFVSVYAVCCDSLVLL